MGAQHDDTITRGKASGDRRGFTAEAGHLHGAPGSLKSLSLVLLTLEQPDAGPLALIEERADRNLERRGGAWPL